MSFASIIGNGQLLLFFALIITITSCWVTSRWVSYLGYILSCGLAYWYHFIEPFSFIYLLLITFGLLTYQKAPSFIKGILAILLGVFIFCLCLHLLPGFHNFKIIDQIKLSFDSKPYSSYINVDKVLVGSLLLLFYTTLNQSLKEWKVTLRVLPIPLIYVCALLLGTAFAMHYIRIDFKVPSILGWWIPTNLLLVCVVEEIFYRGFVQRELTKIFSSFKGGNWFALGGAAIVFGASHHTGGVPYVILSTLAGVGYGYVFMRSNRIESSILLHFLVNLIHILAFSYPALMRG
ncbi:MAG: hypothetical protein BGO77_06755 [Caedibacter sp. 37-49]|nr:MAG: hypothetical protein BGO77_06755 [Caedibacter sp. 37-49]